MAEIEFHLDAFTIQELLATASGIVTALTENEHFPQPNPPTADLDRLRRELSAAEEEHRRQRTAAAAAKLKRDICAEELRRALALEAEYVQEASGGSIAKILSANLHVEEQTSYWPFGHLGQVEDVSASSGDQPGEIDLDWEPVAGASGYEVEIAYDLLGEGPWEQIGATIQSRLTINHLSNKTRYWFRVRAVGERGAGEWSEALMKFAP